VQAAAGQDGSRTVKADLDLDGSDEELRWSDPGSTLTVTLTSNSKKFTLDHKRLSVVKYDSNYYFVTTRVESELGPWYREVFYLTRTGFVRICSFDGKGQPP